MRKLVLIFSLLITCTFAVKVNNTGIKHEWGRLVNSEVGKQNSLYREYIWTFDNEYFITVVIAQTKNIKFGSDEIGRVDIRLLNRFRKE